MSNNARVKTILILAANPKNTAPLRLDQEIREIDEGLRRANKRELYKLEQKWAVRSRDFYRAILDYQPNIVHFCGHGAGQDGIVLEDDTGKMVLVQTNVLASVFKLFAKKGVECVILNACYSEVQADAISQYVNYVVGMNRAVGDRAAVAFAVAFYDGIAAGYEVEEAYDLGRAQMMSFLEHETPIFKKRRNIVNAPIDDVSISFEDVIPPNPYQGLSAFGEEDADFFFGQEKFVNNLVEVTHKQPLVAVVGPSGSGKSSVVYAGLIPKLRKEGNWLIESFRPGKEPFEPLAFALVRQLEPEAGETQQLRETMGLAGDLRNCRITLPQVVARILERNPGKRLLLVADQFEELYTLCQVKEEQERFANDLLAAIGQENITLVLTLRADFYGYVLSYRPFRDALQEFTPQLLSSMKREELQAAVELPAQKLEVQLEAQLTQHILNDVGEEPGNLPLLEFALTRLWEKQINRELTHQAYEEIGGVKKAIANHAEQIYQKLSETEKKQAQRIFVQLVRPGEGTEDTRRVATRAEVGEDNWNLVSYLAGYQARLVVTGRQEQEDTVEVVHEALIREWGTLREWINANRQFRTWQERLKVALREWKNNNHDSGGLLRGTPLSVAEDWLRQRAREMTQEEQNYILASVKERNREKQQRERRRQLTILGLSGFSVIALGLAGIAGWQRQNAVKSEIKALTASSEALLISNQHLEGLIAALKAGQEWKQLKKLPWVETNTQTTVVKALQNVLYKIRENNRLSGHNDVVTTVAFSLDGQIIATGDGKGKVKLWNQNGKLLQTLDADKKKLYAVAISPDAQMIASASDDKTVKLWNREGKLINTLAEHSDEVHGVAFSPDGEMIASASWGNTDTIKLWNKDGTLRKNINLDVEYPQQSTVAFSPKGEIIATGGWDGQVRFWDKNGILLKTLKVLQNGGEVYGVVFNRQGNMIATASDDKTVKLWRTSDGKLLNTLPGHSAAVKGVAFSPHGEMIASVSDDTTVKLWRTSDATLLNTFSGHSAAVNAVAFSPEAEKIATASEDGTVKIWKPGGTPLKALTGYTSSVYAVAFSPNGEMIATGDKNKNVKLWNRDGTLHKTLGSHDDWVYGVAISPNNQMIASGGGEGTVKLWNRDGNLLQNLRGDNYDVIRAVSFSPDGQIMASASDDTTVKLWRISDGKLLNTLEGHSAEVNAVSFSLDGKTIASASDDTTVKLWRTSDGKLLNTLEGHSAEVNAVSFNLDGKTIASASDDTMVKLWRASDGKLLKTLEGHSAEVNAVSFSLDGKTIASASNDTMVKLWRTSDDKLLKTLEGHSAQVWGVSFSPDGETLASASGDKTVILWNLEETDELNRLLKYACEWGGEYLKTNPHITEKDKHLCDNIS
jgi:WD40 repeat protein